MTDENHTNDDEWLLTPEDRIEELETQLFDLQQLLIRQDYQLTATQVILKTLLLQLSERAMLPIDDVKRQAIYQLSRLAEQSSQPELSEEFALVAEQMFEFPES